MRRAAPQEDLEALDRRGTAHEKQDASASETEAGPRRGGAARAEELDVDPARDPAHAVGGARRSTTPAPGSRATWRPRYGRRGRPPAPRPPRGWRARGRRGRRPARSGRRPACGTSARSARRGSGGRARRRRGPTASSGRGAARTPRRSRRANATTPSTNASRSAAISTGGTGRCGPASTCTTRAPWRERHDGGNAGRLAAREHVHRNPEPPQVAGDLADVDVHAARLLPPERGERARVHGDDGDALHATTARGAGTGARPAAARSRSTTARTAMASAHGPSRPRHAAHHGLEVLDHRPVRVGAAGDDRPRHARRGDGA